MKIDPVADIKEVVADKELSASSKMVWLMLFFENGYNMFTTVYSDIAKQLDINEWTLKSNMRFLMRRGAVRVNATYSTKGRSGSQFELVKPEKWD